MAPNICACMHRYQPPTRGWGERLRDQIAYLGHEGTPLFGPEGILDAAGARTQLLGLAGQHVAFHRLILSLAPTSGARSSAEVMLWTREMLADLGARVQRTLIYVGAAHQENGLPHSHVVIGGRAPVAGTFLWSDVRFRVGDYAYLRARGTEHAQALAAGTAARRTTLARYAQTRHAHGGDGRGKV